MAAERKYTDRDVRENPSLRDLAEEYVQNYGGDFEPLVEASKDLESGRTLSTQQVRVVLNCMRYDRNVAADMPDPVRPPLRIVESPVLRRPKNKDQCDETESHEPHAWYEDEVRWKGRHYCRGIAFKINRERYWMDTWVNRPFAVARGGKMIHFTSAQGSGILWLPPEHEYGMAQPTKLAVRTLCRYPSVVNDPILLTPHEAMLLSASPVNGLPFCTHCTYEIEEETQWQRS